MAGLRDKSYQNSLRTAAQACGHDVYYLPLEAKLATSPIAAFLKDEAVTDILINSPADIYINKQGMLIKTEAAFAGQSDIDELAALILGTLGREIDSKRPLADARLPDGSRVNIISPPMAIHGTVISIRKFPNQDITLDKLVSLGSIPSEVSEFLKLCAQCRLSLLISGGTGTGKTTMLNAISHYIPKTERIITIEDTAELKLQQPHVVTLETKEPLIRGDRTAEVSMADLVRNALRMRPDRIIVGEVRGPEAFDMIQAMNTGHEGSMTTVHANSPRDAITRIENLLGPTMQNTPVISVRRQIVSALNLIIQLGYDEHGKRHITSITDLVGMEGDIPQMQEIFMLPPQGAATSQQQGNESLVWSGIFPRHPKLAEILRKLKSEEINNYQKNEAEDIGLIDKLFAGA